MKPAAWFLNYWLPVLLWMGVIFGFSTDVGSSQRTSRIIGPILRWLIPDVSDDTVARVQLVVRKGGHLTEYAILSALVWRALRHSKQSRDKTLRHPWSRRQAAAAIVIAVLFAATDEWHQSSVPSRQGQISDVLIDALGATAGLVAIWLGGKYLKRW